MADFDNDAEKVLRFVLEERRRELAFMNMRHIDLKRLNKEARFQKTIVHKAEGMEYKLLPEQQRNTSARSGLQPLLSIPTGHSIHNDSLITYAAKAGWTDPVTVQPG